MGSPYRRGRDVPQGGSRPHPGTHVGKARSFWIEPFRETLMHRMAGASFALLLLACPALADNASGPVVYRETGQASWYGPGFDGRKTASGTVFDQHQLTAAHPKLPLGSEARVTNLQNGKSVTVKIDDRGPYAGGRDIDLSKAAANRIGVVDGGTAPVRIEATKAQIDKAVDAPTEAPKVQAQLDAAKKRAEVKEPAERRLVQNMIERNVASGS